jgi:uncharacterized phage-like protein YoqJ/5-methylcytosine-specific restriction endonuclease McrA
LSRKKKKNSEFVNNKRAALRKVRQYLKGKGYITHAPKLKENHLIKEFADLQGLEIPVGIKLKRWITNLYLSGECIDCCQTDQGFYLSKEWRNLRKKVLKTYGAVCMKCGSKDDIHIDHIKPRSKYPSLELEFSNMQVLCRICNFSKSNRNEVDYRPNTLLGVTNNFKIRSKGMVIAVTGHRPDKLGSEYDMKGPISKYIYDELCKIVTDLKPTKVISGMALGVDMLWANVAINKNIPFVAAIPFLGQEKKWPEPSQRIYNKMLSHATEVVTVCPGDYAAFKMQKRNEWMVDNCDMLVAVWDGSQGGTSNCVNYATSKGKVIKRINPLIRG